jgi:AcrR family transcriptional regulator
MPRHVDAKERRREILEIAYAILLADGLQGVSFRNVASRMGGSPALVTHYYPSRQELVDALLSFAMDQWKDELDSLETGIEDPRERLRVLLGWIVPATEGRLKGERGRLNLLANHGQDAETRAMLQEWDRYGRALVRRYVRPLVPDAERDRVLEILRVTTYGIMFSALQDPAGWTPRRQLEMIDTQLRFLGLADP